MAEEHFDIGDPEEIKLLRAINRDEQRLGNVDWLPYLSELVKMIGLMKKPISFIGCAWALLQEIDDFSKRADILGMWQDLAPQCFTTKEAADAFIADMDCLIRIYIRLRGLVLMQGASMPHTYDTADGGKGLNELALIWSEQYLHNIDLVALASEVHTSVQTGEKAPMIEHFLYSSRQYNELPFDNIYDFSRNLFLAESFRQYLVDGKMYTDTPMAFGDIKRKIRNACFDEYIRLRIQQIEVELEDDNSLLLDPTIDYYYQQLYDEERSVVDREEMFESFRGSQAYYDRWYRGRPEVLQMMKYFMDYLDWKMKNLHVQSQTNNTIVQGDYIAGDKITGDVIKNVAPGGVGKQVIYGVQPTTETAPPEPSRSSDSSSAHRVSDEELFKYIHYRIIDDAEKLKVHKMVCNIVRLPKMQQVCDALFELMKDELVLSTIDQSAMLSELRRLGLPSDQKGFSDPNFYSYYRTK